MRRRPAAMFLCLLVVVGLRPDTPTLARGSVERIVYFTAFKNGLSGWSGTTRKWRTRPKSITTDSRGSTVLIAPYNVRIKNYAVQSKFRVVAWRNGSSSDAMVGLLFRGPRVVSYLRPRMTGKQGLVAGLYRLQGTTSVRVKQAYELGSLWGHQYTYNPAHSLHTYRVEVRGVSIKVFVDGRRVLSLSWNDSVGGTRVGLVVSNAVVEVKGFRVTRL